MVAFEKTFAIISVVVVSVLLLRIIVPFAKYFAKQLVGFAIIMVVSLGLYYGTRPLLSPICESIGIPFYVVAIVYCIVVSAAVWKWLADWIEK